MAERTEREVLFHLIEVCQDGERGEHAALHAYEEALSGMLPPTVTSLVEQQREAMRKANDRIRAIDMGHS